MDAPEIEAFVIMPFAQEMRRNYDLVIGPALRRGKVRPIRADEEQSGHIHAQMLSRILESGLTVADISGTNPNVFYELGVAHSLRSRTLMVVREDCAKTIPFDVMPYRVFIFKDPAVAKSEEIEADIVRLAEEISRVARDANLAVPNPVQAFLAERSAVDSPRSVYLPSLSSAVHDM